MGLTLVQNSYILFSKEKSGYKIWVYKNPSWAETPFERTKVVKNDVTPSSVNVTKPYVIGDIIKIKLATEWRHASPCPARAGIYQPILHWI